MELSVIISTHNPDVGRLNRALHALAKQSLDPGLWETVLVDNASVPSLALSQLDSSILTSNIRIVTETKLGLTSARRRGFMETDSEILVMVDDDNILHQDYLKNVLSIFAHHGRVGAIGGRSEPEFESAPPSWVREFDDLLACRDLGHLPLLAKMELDKAGQLRVYPGCAPIGAGMALRRRACAGWLLKNESSLLSDRKGTELTSGGDNDIIFSILEQEWEVGYFPELSLIHLIPSARANKGYLAKLNRGIAMSWIQVLSQHGACPWRAIQPWTVPLRQMKAWVTYHAWSGPEAFIRWQGACGHFAGLAAIDRPHI